MDRRAGDTRKAEYALLKLDEALGLLGSCAAGVREAEDDNAMPHQRSALNIAIPDALVFGEHGETVLTYVAQPVFIGNALSRMLAEHIGKPTASRAVGAAVGKNPISFVVPCHRVVGSTGALTGYHWGVPRKRAIMGWEAGVIA